jgi:hypothetical protein
MKEFRVRVSVTLRLTLYSQSVRLGAQPLETHDQYFFQLNTCGYSPYVTSCLTRGWSVIYNYCWLSPAQSFSGPSPVGHMTIFYCLEVETSPTWRTRYLYLYAPETGWPSYILGTEYPFMASYEAQGYGNGVRTRLHKWY